MRARGFTLIELMVVVALLGMAMALVPLNMDSFGARSRLTSAANTVVAAFSSVKAQAIYDGYEAYLEFGLFKDDDDKVRPGYRIRYTNLPAQERGQGDEQYNQELAQAREREREWRTTSWSKLPDSVDIVGLSESRGNWQRASEDRVFAVGFTAAGNVDRPVAIRLENEQLEVRREYRTITVEINPMTSVASWREGLHELRPKRPASDFGH